MSREGIGTVLAMVVATAIITIGAILTPFIHLQVAAGIFVLLTILTVYFFRDPEREIPKQDRIVVSPADGKVVEICEMVEDRYLKSVATRVSIFLSVFDVHVNRVPLSGTIGYFDYKRGAFMQAFKSEASERNEQTIIGIENGKHKILFKQIAGILARRIVCHVRLGNKVELGERFGIIKFGSRVDIFLPPNMEVKVKLRDKVKGGLSIIGVFTNDA